VYIPYINSANGIKEMNNLMRCTHKETKYKLVATAYEIKRRHYQQFTMELCCSKCGKKV
tara:strand:- start:1857 stop:2033 length:177 start_codon:yes stop_codon:yes gene_type:complete